MKTQPKLRKKSFTVVEQACHEVHGFTKLWEDLHQKITLSGHSLSTLHNYGRKIAQLSLHFGKLPQHINEKEINRYLASLARKSNSPSLSDFKSRSWTTLLFPIAQAQRQGRQLPSTKEKSCPWYSTSECRALFKPGTA